MSAETFEIKASVRVIAGKGASRRLRRLDGQVPGIVYGGTDKPVQISVEHKELVKHLESESFYSHIIDLNLDGKSESVILKDVQRHPSKPRILHIDFMRILKSVKITVSVPLHFLNEANCVGVKTGGGLITHTMTQLEISCLPANLPEFIEVDMLDVVVGQTLHISDIKLPKDVESVALSQGPDHDLPVVSVNKPKGAAADLEEDAADDAE